MERAAAIAADARDNAKQAEEAYLIEADTANSTAGRDVSLAYAVGYAKRAGVAQSIASAILKEAASITPKGDV